jgi:alpha-tubulin suppressor-like RCC1 family protein
MGDSSGTNVELKDYTTKIWKLDDDDKFIDIAAGKHFTFAITEKGKMFGAGYLMHRRIRQALAGEQNRDEDKPFEIKLPEGYKPLSAICSDRQYVVLIHAEKDGQKVNLGGGSQSDLRGVGPDVADGCIKPLKLPEKVYFPTIVTQGNSVFAIDEDKNLWMWGKNFSTAAEWIENYKDESTPAKIIWFSKKNLKVEDIRAGFNSAIVKTVNESGKIEFYSVSEGESSSDRFGQTKEEFNRVVCKMIGFNTEKVLDFACGRVNTMMIMKDTGDAKETVPGKSGIHGLTHAYKEEASPSW